MKTGTVLAEYKKMSDEELAHRYRHRHEQPALTQLFERYGHLVFGLCLSFIEQPGLSANTTHTIFIKLVDDLKRYDEISFKPWLYNYVRNYCVSHGYKSDTIITDDAAQFSQRFTIETQAQATALDKAIATLPAEQRKCIELFYINRMNYKDIAVSADYPLKKVKENLRSAKRYLKEHIEKIGA